MLHVKNLQKKGVFEPLSFSLGAGIHLLVGQEGKGKSVLLRVLAGVENHGWAGSIQFQDSRLESSPLQYKRRIGYKGPQLFAPDISWTVAEFLWYMGKLRGIPTSLLEARIGFWMRELGLTPLHDSPLACLSGGQREQIHFLQSLLGRPGLLLLDSPVAELDNQAKLKVCNILSALASSCCILIATAEVEVFLPWANRIMVLENRRLVVSGTPVT